MKADFLFLFLFGALMKGCDGSILISSKPGKGVLAEKDAYDNKNLAAEAFETITKVKALVESKCPGVVSCADILVIAARDFVHLVMCLLHLFHSIFILSCFELFS